MAKNQTATRSKQKAIYCKKENRDAMYEKWTNLGWTLVREYVEKDWPYVTLRFEKEEQDGESKTCSKTRQ